MPPASAMSPHMFGVGLAEEFSGDLVGALRDRGVHISQRGRSVRIAPHLHVTPTDIVRLLDACSSALRE